MSALHRLVLGTALTHQAAAVVAAAKDWTAERRFALDDQSVSALAVLRGLTLWDDLLTHCEPSAAASVMPDVVLSEVNA